MLPACSTVTGRLAPGGCWKEIHPVNADGLKPLSWHRARTQVFWGSLLPGHVFSAQKPSGANSSRGGGGETSLGEDSGRTEQGTEGEASPTGAQYVTKVKQILSALLASPGKLGRASEENNRDIPWSQPGRWVGKKWQVSLQELHFKIKVKFKTNVWAGEKHHDQKGMNPQRATLTRRSNLQGNCLGILLHPTGLCLWVLSLRDIDGERSLTFSGTGPRGQPASRWRQASSPSQWRPDACGQTASRCARRRSPGGHCVGQRPSPSTCDGLGGPSTTRRCRSAGRRQTWVKGSSTLAFPESSPISPTPLPTPTPTSIITTGRLAPILNSQSLNLKFNPQGLVWDGFHTKKNTSSLSRHLSLSLRVC